MKKIYNAVLIGTGRIGFLLGFDKKREQPASHTMALFDNKKINLIAACDTDHERLEQWQKFAKKNHSPSYIFNSSDELYQNIKDIDIITVAVNEEAHLEQCIKAIEQKPRLVILEKPVALNSTEAQKIKERCEKFNVPILVNHERRFAYDYKTAKNLIKELGDIQWIHASLNSGLRVYGKEFEKDGAYSLLHDGTHLVDIVNFLCDEKLSNPIVTNIFRDEKNIVRNFTAHFKTSKIPDVTISMSGRSKFFEFAVDITGTLGRICIGNGYFKFYKRKESNLYTGFYSLKREKIKLPKKTGYFANMIQNAVDFLDGRENLISPLDVAIEDLKVLEEIKKNFI